MIELNLSVNKKNIPIKVINLVVAGWTGRDKAAIEHHIKELEVLGVQRPRCTPCYYRVSEKLLSTADDFQFVGDDSSGEVEFVLFSTEQGLMVGLGSDHTDRKVESYGVTVSKQMCAKPVAREVWLFDEVRNHWDQLITRSWIIEGGNRVLYQEGKVEKMLPPADLIKGYVGSVDMPIGTAMFCGTHAVIGDIRGASEFEMELEDPVLQRVIRHSYSCTKLNIAD